MEDFKGNTDLGSQLSRDLKIQQAKTPPCRELGLWEKRADDIKA